MSRPIKPRRICKEPEYQYFLPQGKPRGKEVMTIDEYEVIRLMDMLHFSQDETAKQMQVARTTIQAIYDSARSKLAKLLVEGYSLEIQGGSFMICPRSESCCGRNCTRRGCQGKICQEQMEGIKMNIAVTYEEGMVFQHFGHCQHFLLCETNENKIVKTSIIETGESGHGALASLLSDHQVDVLICGGIGGGARMALQEAGIRLFPGVTGDAKESVMELLEGRLQFNPDTMCQHHHEEEGSCHHCGENKHGCAGN